MKKAYVYKVNLIVEDVIDNLETQNKIDSLIDDISIQLNMYHLNFGIFLKIRTLENAQSVIHGCRIFEKRGYSNKWILPSKGDACSPNRRSNFRK